MVSEISEKIQADAQEYGRHVRGGDWRLGLLVARNVKLGAGAGGATRFKSQKTPQIAARPDSPEPKVSATKFASLSGTGKERVMNHLEMWAKAAEAGLVPAIDTLSPGDGDDITLPDAELASDYYTSVSGGFNGGKDRQPTVQQAKAILEQLPAKKAVKLIAEVLDTEPITDALKGDEEASDHVFQVTMNLSGIGKGKKLPTPKAPRGMREMEVVMSLIGVLGKIRELAIEDPDTPLLVECKNLMRETLGILDGIAAIDDPEQVGRMLDEFGDFLATQQQQQ